MLMEVIIKVFSNILINDDETDINIELSDNGSDYIVAKEYNDIKHSINVNNNTLEIKVENNRKWYNKIFSFNIYRK